MFVILTQIWNPPYMWKGTNRIFWQKKKDPPVWKERRWMVTQLSLIPSHMPTGDQSDDREIDLKVQEKTSKNIPICIVTFFLNRLEWKVGDIKRLLKKMNTEPFWWFDIKQSIPHTVLVVRLFVNTVYKTLILTNSTKSTTLRCFLFISFEVKCFNKSLFGVP